MFELVSQHQLGIAMLLAVLLMAAACTTRYVVHPGAINQADSAAYDALLAAEAAIDEAKAEYAAGRLAGKKQTLDVLIGAYNVARESWITYRGAVAVNLPADSYLDRLNSNLADLTNAIRQFRGKEAK
jgi:hypothetical protein